MQWRRDPTRRFARYPYYEPFELDIESQTFVGDILAARQPNGVGYPVTTDDLCYIIESMADDLDWCADLTHYGDGVEGITEFRIGKRPLVKIASHLSAKNMVNRFRMTLAHELAHVKFHNCLYQVDEYAPMLFNQVAPPPRPCSQESVNGGRGQNDWMEWQAGYVGGAILMPVHALRALVSQEIGGSLPETDSVAEMALCEKVASAFEVSVAASRVRLSQLGIIVKAGQLKLG